LQKSVLTIAISWTALAAMACAKPAAITDCVAKDNARPACTFQNPEDFALLPDGRTLLISQMGQMDGSASGSLVYLNLESKWVTLAWAGEYAGKAHVAGGWGDPACPGPPTAAFSPHGLSMGLRPDGTLQILVVNHGGREAVEFFELIALGERPMIGWRGCAIAPEDTRMNDVAALPDGGFVVTKMQPVHAETLYTLAGMIGFSTGYVLEWQPATGYKKIEGTDGRFPNGIEASRDGEAFYVDMYFGGEVRKISRRTGETLASVDVEHPDNVLWSPDGTLLVASHNTSVTNIFGCMRIEKGACPARFSIIQLDPDTLAKTVLYENEGPPMGAGTSAMHIGKELIIGTFKGDRILRVDIGATPTGDRSASTSGSLHAAL
jgi:hypothetical protein